MNRVVIFVLGLLFSSFVAFAQTAERLSLQECYRLARANYPLIKQQSLIQNASDFSVENINKGNLPKINLVAQATYQSDVVGLPINTPNVPTLDKDQYQIYAEINQTIYNGNRIDKEVEMQETLNSIEQNQVEVELYDIYKRISQLYFGILLIQEQEQQLVLQEEDIQLAMDKVHVSIQNGVAIESDYHTLKANQLLVKQKAAELQAMKKAYSQMLELFIGQNIGNAIVLSKPMETLTTEDKIDRLELDLLDHRISLIDLQTEMLDTKVGPKFSFFARAGYGKPGLNILSNDFDTYFLGGARLEWPLFNFYTSKREKEINEIEKDKLLNQKETFLFNTKLEVANKNTEIEKYQQLLTMDSEIIKSYSQVKQTSLFKLENGTIDVNDYVRDVNQESMAIQNRSLHEIQLLMKIEELKITQGIK